MRYAHCALRVTGLPDRWTSSWLYCKSASGHKESDNALPKGASAMKRRDFLALGAAMLCTGTTVSRALAQAKYPDRPIKLVVPFVPVGVNDAVSRLWADRVKAPLGTVFIENQGGAGGAGGSAAGAPAEPNSYTSLLGRASTQARNPI